MKSTSVRLRGSLQMPLLNRIRLLISPPTFVHTCCRIRMSCQNPPSLSALPTELCDLIPELSAIKLVDLASLAQVNRRFHIIFTPYLHRAAVRNRPNFPAQTSRCGDLAGLEFAYQCGAKIDVIHKIHLKGSQTKILGAPQRKYAGEHRYTLL